MEMMGCVASSSYRLLILVVFNDTCGCLLRVHSSSDFEFSGRPGSRWRVKLIISGQSYICVCDGSSTSLHHHDITSTRCRRTSQRLWTKNKNSAVSFFIFLLIYKDAKLALIKVNHQHSEPWCETTTEYESMESRKRVPWVQSVHSLQSQ